MQEKEEEQSSLVEKCSIVLLSLSYFKSFVKNKFHLFFPKPYRETKMCFIKFQNPGSGNGPALAGASVTNMSLFTQLLHSKRKKSQNKRDQKTGPNQLRIII